MNDTHVLIQSLKEATAAFVKEREWEQFHSPKNLSMCIAAEAGELLEHFRWVESKDSYELFEKKRTEIEEEMADLFIVLFCLSNRMNSDISSLVLDKIEKIKKKYPVDKAKGKSAKYNEL